MIRYFLAKGDWAGTARIIEGLENFTCSIPPPRAQIATLGMKTWCSRCQQEGEIIPSQGERPRGMAFNGMPWALSGDLNRCACGETEFSVIRGLKTNISNTSCSHLNGEATIFQAPPEFYRTKNLDVEVGPGREVIHAFRSDLDRPRRATEYVTAVGGHTFFLYTADSAPNELRGNLPVDMNQILQALAVIPLQHIRQIVSIDINPGPSPDALVLRDGTMTSSAATGGNGHLSFFPLAYKIAQEQFNHLLTHETGHFWQELLWQDDMKKNNYIDAIASDNAWPSRYAMENEYEDFAESSDMYWTSKGTPCEAEGRRRYPARYAYFDLIAGLG